MTGRAVAAADGAVGVAAGEVAAPRLEDTDWRAGQILVRGTADQWERLPLPRTWVRRWPTACDFGARSTIDVTCSCGCVYPGPLTIRLVCSLMPNAYIRAGTDPTGDHRLRHTVATEIRRTGGSMSEISQLLRHRRSVTTAVYTCDAGIFAWRSRRQMPDAAYEPGPAPQSAPTPPRTGERSGSATGADPTGTAPSSPA